MYNGRILAHSVEDISSSFSLLEFLKSFIFKIHFFFLNFNQALFA